MAARGNKLPDNLPQLQNLIKRDPTLYREEFLQQYRHYRANLDIFRLKPSQDGKAFGDLANFISHVIHCYPDELATFPGEISGLLEEHYSVLPSDLRQTLCKALILLRSKDAVSSTAVLELFFKLFRCNDKHLRELLHRHIVSDIKNMNAKHKNNKANKTLQNFMYAMLSDSSPIAAKKSLDVMIELYKRNIWHDAKTVNVIATACFSKVTKILVAAVHFFLGTDEDDDDEKSDDEGEDTKATAKSLLLANKVAKKKRSSQRRLKHALDNVKKKEKAKGRHSTPNFSALHLLNDPQGFAEKLFAQLRASNERFEVRLMLINLISRLIGTHQLFVLNFYPFLQKYLQPHQKDVTLVLAYAAQACHELVPPDVLEPLLMALVNNFVNDRSSVEVMAVGLNAAREICVRCPLVMTEALLGDLAQYKTHRDKTVSNAAKSLIQLYRTVNPALLRRKDRGAPQATESDEAFGEEATGGVAASRQYGAQRTAKFVPGAELLAEELVKKGGDVDMADGEGDGWEGWETASEASDESGEWVNVSHSEDEGDADMKDAEEPPVEIDPETRRRLANEISTQRILTPEDFATIRKLQLKRQLEGPSGRRGKKRKQAEVEEEDEVAAAAEIALRPSEVVDPDTIEAGAKKRRHDYEARLQSVLEGREGRETFGSKRGQHNAEKSHTNREKRKTKNFMMVVHGQKMREKQLRSMRDRQVQERAAIEKRKKAFI